MRKRIGLYFILAIVFLAILTGLFLMFRSGKESGQVSGEVYLYASDAKALTIRDEKGEISSVDLSSPDLKFEDISGNNFSLADLRRGFKVEVLGLWGDKKTFIANSLTLVKTPNISVFTPSAGEEVGLPLVGSGEARVFESAYRYRLLDADGSMLAEGFGTAHAPDMGQFGPFSFSLFYPAPKGKTGTLEVFDNSAKDGAEIDMVQVPVVFKRDISKNEEETNIKLFFTNSVKDPKAEECQKTYPVIRAVKKTPALERSALDLLLSGPLEKEKKEGYGTALNEGTAVSGINIEKGVAVVDFNKKLMEKVGGSCRVGAMRSQIENTLKQFSGVKEVTITMEGKTEGVLEP